MKNELISWLKSFVFAFAFVFVIQHFFFVPTIVQGESMMPTFQDGNGLIVSKISEIERFDKIVFHAPDSEKNYIKRVIGLPGDKVSMEDDTLYINGRSYEEPYLEENKKSLFPLSNLTGDFTLEELTGEKNVPDGYLFVLGDNRLKSKDSRHFGFIPIKSVIGTAEVQVWPLNQVGRTKE
ncbi:MAG TPA: signal peptidase I [Chondromyces sp.]|nr:signal peptidase I [Chondromyces sp.]